MNVMNTHVEVVENNALVRKYPDNSLGDQKREVGETLTVFDMLRTMMDRPQP